MEEHGVSESLIEAAIAGDLDALDLLWKGTRRWVATILLAHKPNDADLDDLLQVVAMQLCRKISDIRDVQAFRSWLRTVAINVAREEGRKTNRRKRSMLHLVGMERSDRQTTTPADEVIEESDESRKVYQAAMSLPLGYREPVLLRCTRSMSYQQISELLDLPITTIETRIARGRRMLREILVQQEQHNENQRNENQRRVAFAAQGSGGAL